MQVAKDGLLLGQVGWVLQGWKQQGWTRVGPTGLEASWARCMGLGGSS